MAFPFDVEELFGTRGRVPVLVDFEGLSYRGSLAPMGGRHLLGVRKDIREALGKQVGDSLSVVLERDAKKRTVRVPKDLVAALLASAEAKNRFDELSYTHRKEFAAWVEEAKRRETRERRVAKTVEMVLAGRSR